MAIIYHDLSTNHGQPLTTSKVSPLREDALVAQGLHVIWAPLLSSAPTAGDPKRHRWNQQVLAKGGQDVGPGGIVGQMGDKYVKAIGWLDDWGDISHQSKLSCPMLLPIRHGIEKYEHNDNDIDATAWRP